eukprot:Nitzschia sp. Nitz4//scaffold256_size27904//16095//17354//NITZ4_008169-RA/size27904-processed-gene-0.8-mRNA-1//1//CDS//3329544411//2393//frame0
MTCHRSFLSLLLLGWSIFAAVAEEGTSNTNYTSPDVLTQISLGGFRVILSPTPDELTNVDYVLGSAIQDLVDSKLAQLYGEEFEYMYVAGVNKVEFNDGSTRKLSGVRNLQDFASTTVTFVGGVVAFGDEPETDIRRTIKEIVEADLPAILGNKDHPWAPIDTVQFISLSTSAPTSAPTSSPTAPSPQVNAGLDGSVYQTDEGLSTAQRSVRVTFGVLGVFFVLFGVIFLAKGSRQRRQEALAEALEESENESVHDLKSTMTPHHMDNGGEEVLSESGRRSEMTQYANTSDRYDTVSVGPSVASDWTMQTSDTRFSGLTSLQQRYGGAAAYASSETFERDRQITLQKDMLQSEWTTTRPRVTYNENPVEVSTRYTPSRTDDGAVSPTVSFEQAYEESQGEEIYLVPPSRANKTRDGEII